MNLEMMALQKALMQQKKLTNRLLVLFSTGCLCLLSFFFFSFTRNTEKDVLRVKGVVIVDEHGKERILIGAPTPDAKNRVRMDTVRVRALWATKSKDPNQYMQRYKDYNHQASGIIFLDENGFDRVAIGSSVPDPNIGQRVGNQAGMVFFDDKGTERGGLGILNVKGGHRAVMVLDGADGRDAVSISVRENGQTGFLAAALQEKALFIGSAPANVLTPEPFTGFIVANKGKIQHKFNVALPEDSSRAK